MAEVNVNKISEVLSPQKSLKSEKEKSVKQEPSIFANQLALMDLWGEGWEDKPIKA